MRSVKITVIKKVEHKDLITQYENYIEEPCKLNIGDSFIIKNIDDIPQGMCVSAYMSLYPFIMNLLYNGNDIYSKYVTEKNKGSVLTLQNIKDIINGQPLQKDHRMYCQSIHQSNARQQRFHQHYLLRHIDNYRSAYRR